MSELADALVELHEAAEHEDPPVYRFTIWCLECDWSVRSPVLSHWSRCDSCASMNLGVEDHGHQ